MTTKIRTQERLPYGIDSKHSYFRDLYLATFADRTHRASVDRALTKGGIASAGTVPIPGPKHAGPEGTLEAARRRLAISAELRDLSSTPGAGGEFVPAGGAPPYIADAFATAARAKAVLPQVLNRRDLPEAGLVVQTARFATGAAVAIQQDLGAVQETDPTTATASAPVGLIAGQVDVSQQAFDHASPGFDVALAAELGNALGAQVDSQIISGSGSAGQLRGIRNVSGVSSATYTDTTPTQSEFWHQLMSLLATTATAYGAMPNTVLLHPRRAAWLSAWTDSAGMPAVINWPEGVRPVNVGSIPTNLGGGTEDVAIVLQASESVLAQRAPSFAVMPDVLSGTLEVRVQARQYAALLANRQPASIGILSGTGLIAPVF